MLSTDCSCIVTYCPNYQGNGSSLGLLGLSNGMVLWRNWMSHQEQMVSPCSYQQVYYISSTAYPGHPPLWAPWSTFSLSPSTSWWRSSATFMWAFPNIDNPVTNLSDLDPLYVLDSPKPLLGTLSKYFWTTLTATSATRFETYVSLIQKLIPPLFSMAKHVNLMVVI